MAENFYDIVLSVKQLKNNALYKHILMSVCYNLRCIMAVTDKLISIPSVTPLEIETLKSVGFNIKHTAPIEKCNCYDGCYSCSYTYVEISL
jgi:hypothetical protein